MFLLSIKERHLSLIKGEQVELVKEMSCEFLMLKAKPYLGTMLISFKVIALA